MLSQGEREVKTFSEAFLLKFQDALQEPSGSQHFISSSMIKCYHTAGAEAPLQTIFCSIHLKTAQAMEALHKLQN